MEGQVARFTRRLAEQGAIWLAGYALVISATPAALAGVALLGLVYARNLEFMHECLHATALPRPRANALFGTLLGIPMLVSFTRWRREHMQHHRDVRIEGFRYAYDRLTTWPEYALHALMLRHFADAAVCIARGDRRYRAVTVALALVACVAAALHSWLPIVLWIAPLPLAAIVHTHIELPEHLGLDAIASNDPLRNSRVLPAGAFVTWLVNANNYHAIHHVAPRLPIASLRGAFTALEPGSVETCSYGAFYRAFFARLARGAQARIP